MHASPTTAKNAAPSLTGTPRLIARTPSHSANDQTAYSMPSGLTEPEMKATIGASAGTLAATVCSSRRRPNSSPASSHVASTVNGSQNADISRAPSSWSNRLPEDAAL